MPRQEGLRVRGLLEAGGGGRLHGDVPLCLTHPAFHLLAEIVIPAPIPSDLCTVLAGPQLVPPPVIGLSGIPVPRKAGQSSAPDGPLIPTTLTPHLRNAWLFGVQGAMTAVWGAENLGEAGDGGRIWSLRDEWERTGGRDQMAIPRTN